MVSDAIRIDTSLVDVVIAAISRRRRKGARFMTSQSNGHTATELLAAPAPVVAILDEGREDILHRWIEIQLSSEAYREGEVDETELRDQSTMLLDAIAAGARESASGSMATPFARARTLLAEMSAARARQGYSPTQTAISIFSLQQAIIDSLQGAVDPDPQAITASVGSVTKLITDLGLVTFETFVRSREDVIVQQTRDLLDLSTPVVKLWDGVLAVPLIGTLDSGRAQSVTEKLLTAIVETEAEFAILDITGVPVIDTLVAQHILKTASAARLMGAECIICGVRPQIAQTIVHLGIGLGDVMTKATMADALKLAFEKMRVAPGKIPSIGA